MNVALAALERHNNGYRFVYYSVAGRRRIWLGNIKRTDAQSIAGRLTALVEHKTRGTELPPAVLRWLQNLNPGPLLNRLADLGLYAMQKRRADDLAEYVREYIAGRTDIGQRSRDRLNNSAAKLIDHLGESMPLQSITPGDCDRFARKMMKAHKASHAGKIVRDVRQIMIAAHRDRLIDENPLANLKTSYKQDASRERYISEALIKRLIDEMPNAEYRALIAVVRFCGLRCPSEPLELTWSNVDWAGNKLRIAEQKTAARPCKLMPSALPYLREAFDEAAAGTVYVINHARKSASKTWRQVTLKAAERAGLDPWPKLFQNMRASCRADLLKQYPINVVNAWLGHSSAVGEKHYSRIDPALYEYEKPSTVASGSFPA